jgi:hypothetical protein
METIGISGIPSHPTHLIKDTSKINSYRTCPRQFFYTYILGWSPDMKSNHLVFGDAWHKACELFAFEGYDDEVVLRAIEVFQSTYRKKFPMETDEIFHPKDPPNAFEALALYSVKYQTDPFEYDIPTFNDVPLVEVSGTVPINTEGGVIHFKQDAVLRRKADGKIFGLERKTKGGYFNEMWWFDWELAFQIKCYQHALLCMFDPEEVGGMIVDGAAFIKSKKLGGTSNFERRMIESGMHQMSIWLWHANRYCAELDQEMETLAECSPNDPVLQAYPMNDQNCSKWFRKCEWHDFCCTWKNPLRHCSAPPMGFHLEYWNPAEKETRHKVNLKEMGGGL